MCQPVGGLPFWDGFFCSVCILLVVLVGASGLFVHCCFICARASPKLIPISAVREHILSSLMYSWHSVEQDSCIPLQLMQRGDRAMHSERVCSVDEQ